MRQGKRVKKILVNELGKIEKLKRKVEKSLKKMPEGVLIVSKSNGVIQFFHKTEKEQKKGKYIDKKNHKLMSRLAQKEYDIKFQRELEKQEKYIKKNFQNTQQIEAKM